MSEDTTKLLPNDGFQRILSRLDSIDTRLDSIETRLTTLEEKVDRRLQETRPIWEQVLTRLDGVESELQSLNRKFRVFYDDILKLQDKQEDLEERVRKLEPAQ